MDAQIANQSAEHELGSVGFRAAEILRPLFGFEFGLLKASSRPGRVTDDAKTSGV
jgi:hypothetical protein